MSLSTPVVTWSCDEVELWMREQGFSRYAEIFKTQHHIDGAALLTLSEKDLKSPPLEMKVLGDIKRLSLSMQKLQSENESHDILHPNLQKVWSLDFTLFLYCSAIIAV